MRSERLWIRIESNIKNALTVLAEQTPGDINDQVRFASEKLIKDRIQELERRNAIAEQLGGDDVEASQQLLALRAAYYGPPAGVTQ